MPRRILSYTSLPSEAADLIHSIAKAIRQARLRRGWSQRLLADKAGVSEDIVQAIESGKPGTSVGSVLSVLWALRLTGPLHALADPATDREGRALELASGRRRGRRRKTTLDTDF
jgi:ribosome-binding protein aMBF1 (putative translation factor)